MTMYPWVVREDGVGFEYSWATVHRIVSTLDEGGEKE